MNKINSINSIIQRNNYDSETLNSEIKISVNQLYIQNTALFSRLDALTKAIEELRNVSMKSTVVYEKKIPAATKKIQSNSAKNRWASYTNEERAARIENAKAGLQKWRDSKKGDVNLPS